MNGERLINDEQCACKKDRFCRFVQFHKEFTKEESNQLQETIVNKKLSRILYISATLAVWSMLAAWIDAIILPALIIYGLSLPGAIYIPILFPIIWTVLNATFKFIYIRQRIGDVISLKDNLVAVLPYAGGAYLLKHWFVGNPLLRKASLAYISSQKNDAVQKILGTLKK